MNRMRNGHANVENARRKKIPRPGPHGPAVFRPEEDEFIDDDFDRFALDDLIRQSQSGGIDIADL